MKRTVIKLYLLLSFLVITNPAVSHPEHNHAGIEEVFHTHSGIAITAALIFAGFFIMRLLRK